MPIYSNNITSNIITNNEYIIYIQIPTRNSETISNNHVINNEFNNEKISSKISDFSSATGQDTNVAKIDSFGGKLVMQKVINFEELLIKILLVLTCVLPVGE